jgi:hypothetical protein
MRSGIAKCAAQAMNMHLEIAFINEGVGPHKALQGALADRLTSVLQQ